MACLTTADVSLKDLHNKTIAIQLGSQGAVIKGRGTYESDPSLGRLLKISFSPGGSALVLSEDQWNGEIASGESANCDYLIAFTCSPSREVPPAVK